MEEERGRGKSCLCCVLERVNQPTHHPLVSNRGEGGGEIVVRGGKNTLVPCVEESCCTYVRCVPAAAFRRLRKDRFTGNLTRMRRRTTTRKKRKVGRLSCFSIHNVCVYMNVYTHAVQTGMSDVCDKCIKKRVKNS